jgi:hypothetical protein
MEELDQARRIFRARFDLYMMKINRRYRTLGDMDYDLVLSAWHHYLRLRKQHLGY